MKALFEEKQRFTQWWLWAIIAPISLGIVSMFAFAVWKQLVMGEPWGEKPMSDDTLITVALGATTIMLAMLMLFFTSVLETVIDRTGLQYKYFPVLRRWRRLERESIESFRHSDSLMANYGVGIDIDGARRINVKGRDMIEIVLYDGTKYRLGTQRPKEFMAALQAMKDKRID